MKPLKNEFSWSKTRDEIFNTCQRKYYYRHYGSWGGWNDEADERTKKLYHLGKLQSRQMWAGSVVHNSIKSTLENIKNGEKSIDKQKVIDETIEIMRGDFKSSKSGYYWKNAKTCALFEHEYEIEVPDNEWKNNANHVKKCLNNFFDSDVFDSICQLAEEQWLEVEKFSSFMLGDLKIWLSLDFSFKEGGKVYIYDWKTGKLDDDPNKLQPLCYCLYAVNAWKVRPEDVKMMEFYLSNKELREYILTDTELNKFIQYVQSASENMTALLDDKEANMAMEERFGFTENERECDYCNYQKVCSRWN
jgi:hypothetical protein